MWIKSWKSFSIHLIQTLSYKVKPQQEEVTFANIYTLKFRNSTKTQIFWIKEQLF